MTDFDPEAVRQVMLAAFRDAQQRRGVADRVATDLTAAVRRVEAGRLAEARAEAKRRFDASTLGQARAALRETVAMYECAGRARSVTEYLACDTRPARGSCSCGCQ